MRSLCLSAAAASRRAKKREREVQLLPDDVVEVILERLAVKSLLRFRTVSKKLKSTIDCRRFQERQMFRQGGPHVLFVCLNSYDDDGRLIERDDDDDRRSFAFGSTSTAYTVSVPTTWEGIYVCHSTCDGLVCLYSFYNQSVGVTFPLSNIQNLIIERMKLKTGVDDYIYTHPKIGFGKDNLTGTYKPVFLTNSSHFGLPNMITTCEVFDFTTQLWRYVQPAFPFTTNPHAHPVYLDGFLYWLTDCEHPKVLSFDLHRNFSCPIFTICILHNRLCVSLKSWPTQDIWSLRCSDKTSSSSSSWTKICSVDLTQISSWLEEPKWSMPWGPDWALSPIAILDKHKLLLQAGGYLGAIIVLDLLTNSYDLLFKPSDDLTSVYYFQSLFYP
ncbi:hypothetical protein N665_0602s0002 [Sinapis alba]|nr:hypothetical protein N665_0602s0002 [Sinapis alba]